MSVRVGDRVPLQARQLQGARRPHRNRAALVRNAAHSRKRPLQAAHQEPRRAGDVSVIVVCRNAKRFDECPVFVK